MLTDLHVAALPDEQWHMLAPRHLRGSRRRPGFSGFSIDCQGLLEAEESLEWLVAPRAGQQGCCGELRSRQALLDHLDCWEVAHTYPFERGVTTSCVTRR